MARHDEKEMYTKAKGQLNMKLDRLTKCEHRKIEQQIETNIKQEYKCLIQATFNNNNNA